MSRILVFASKMDLFFPKFGGLLTYIIIIIIKIFQ